MKRILEKLEGCSSCKKCNNLIVKSATRGKDTYFGLYCGLCESVGLQPYTNNPNDVKQVAIDAIRFEMNGGA